MVRFRVLRTWYVCMCDGGWDTIEYIRQPHFLRCFFQLSYRFFLSLLLFRNDVYLARFSVRFQSGSEWNWTALPSHCECGCVLYVLYGGPQYRINILRGWESRLVSYKRHIFSLLVGTVAEKHRMMATIWSFCKLHTVEPLCLLDPFKWVLAKRRIQTKKKISNVMATRKTHRWHKCRTDLNFLRCD